MQPKELPGSQTNSVSLSVSNVKIYQSYTPSWKANYFTYNYNGIPNQPQIYSHIFYYSPNMRMAFSQLPASMPYQARSRFIQDSLKDSFKPSEQVSQYSRQPDSIESLPQVLSQQQDVLSQLSGLLIPPSLKPKEEEELFHLRQDANLSQPQISPSSDSLTCQTSSPVFLKSILLKSTESYLKFHNLEKSWKTNCIYKLNALKRLVISVFTCENPILLREHLERHPIQPLLIILNFKRFSLNSPK